MAKIRLRAGHVRPVWAGHPWVFSQAIERVDGAPGPGDVVTVVDPKGTPLGRGYWSPKSAIPVRILTRDPDAALDGAWLGARLEEAAQWRRAVLDLPGEETTGYRLVHSAGDGLSGLTVDVFGDVAVVQLSTIGMKRREEEIFAQVARVTRARTVVEVPSAHQEREGLSVTGGVVRGEDVAELSFRERGFEVRVPAEIGQKTGYYFDQRENRALVERLARGRRVLDAFSFLGGFGISAARGGAESVVCLDSSAPAVAAAAAIAQHNGLGDRVEIMRDDVKRALPELARRRESFDLVILDPPKLVPTVKHLERGREAYRKLNANGLALVSPGGLLVTCTCSAAMRTEVFLKMLGLAARDAGREVAVLWMGGQAPDHPSPPSFPEGRYLDCAVLRVGR